MDSIACGYKAVGSLHRGRIGAGLTLDMGVGRVMGRPSEGVRKKRAKAGANEVCMRCE